MNMLLAISMFIIGFIITFFISKEYFRKQEDKKKQERFKLLNELQNEIHYDGSKICNMETCKFFNKFNTIRMGTTYLEIVPCLGCIHYNKQNHYTQK